MIYTELIGRLQYRKGKPQIVHSKVPKRIKINTGHRESSVGETTVTNFTICDKYYYGSNKQAMNQNENRTNQ
jgi:hypothetical protein